MTSILWYQPPIINVNDIVTYNGVIQENNHDSIFYFRQLNKIADKVISKEKPWCGKIDGYFFIKGHLEGLDEKGRKISFMFTSNAADYNSALRKELNTIGYNLDHNTEKCLASKKRSSLIKYGIVSIVILTILITIISFFKQ